MGLTHDIAVPVFHVPAFLEQADASVTRRYPEARIVVVAHLGDGNLHYIVMLRHEQWASVPDKAGLQHEVATMLYDIAAGLGGTFSAEHGIGAIHVAEMARYKPRVEIEIMHQIKRCLDPQGIMNPSRVLPAVEG